MILKTDCEPLFELIKSFHEVTGIKIAVYDTDLNELLAYPRLNGPLCLEVSKNNIHKCGESNTVLCEKCRASSQIVINTCHAGLTEVAAPLEENGIIIGYILYGQITNEPDKAEFLKTVLKKCSGCGIDEDKIKECAENIKYYSDEQLKAISQIMNTMTSYIVEKRYAYAEEKPLIYSVMDYISLHLSENLSVEFLCRHFGVSKSELYKLAKPYMPDGIAEFIKNMRLSRAAHLLKNSDLPIWKIAEETGFSDKEYFLRVFKKRYKIPAGKYRK